MCIRFRFSYKVLFKIKKLKIDCNTLNSTINTVKTNLRIRVIFNIVEVVSSF